MARSLLAFLILLVPIASAPAADPASNIILGLDAKRQSVTAVNVSSGQIFKFTVKDATVFQSAKLCESFEAPVAEMTKDKDFAADFGAADRAKPCCTVTAEPGAAGRVLGVRAHNSGHIDVLLTELKRDGDLVTARWQYCNHGDAVFLTEDLKDRAFRAHLVDQATRKQHDVVRVRDSSRGDSWLMADHGQSSRRVRLESNQALQTWAKFPAPPASSTAVTVMIPGVSEPFDNVPIASE
jgi:hypothetical protein